MSDVNADSQPDPRDILCRVVDVNNAIQSSFQKFVELEKKSLDDLVVLLRDELSQIEFFASTEAKDAE